MIAVAGRPRGGGTPLGAPVAVAFAAHVAAVVAVFLARPSPPRAAPPIYRVDIVAAPPGPRAIGAVTPPSPAPQAAPPPPRAAVAPAVPTAPPRVAPPLRRPPASPSTPVPPPVKPVPQTTTPQPAAGGGPTGGRGADVATVRTQGIDFPYPAYLNNIVRQIALNFSPRNPNAPLRAEVRFIIRRDGSVSDFSFVTRSGNYAFDLDAQGAVEAAAKARAFGPLPAGFPDDALPVVFSFDPSLLR